MPALLHEPLALDFTLFNAADTSLPPSPSLADAVAYALQKCPGFKFLPSNYDGPDPHASPATAHFSCDEFRMYEFKVRRCMRGRSHDWTECPFAHPGEKARRRDPRRIHYSGAPCPDFRKGSCRRGDACEFAHGVFECWLHPARYRTQVCKDGKNCRRRVCFFAHSPEQLRILPTSITSAPTYTDKADGSPVGSPGGAPSTIESTFENLPCHEVLMSNSSGMLRAHQYNSSPPPSSMMHPSVQVNPMSMHLDNSNGSALRRAMVQNFLACKGYGANLNAAEYPSIPDGYEGLVEAQMVPSSYLSMQSNHLRNGKNEGMFSKLSLPLKESSYEHASHRHGFTSPTSTLAGHTFSPPPLSPPLSPVTSPNGDRIKDTVTNARNDFQYNLYMDGINARKNTGEPTFMYNNVSSLEGLGFCLQNLQIRDDANDWRYMQRSPLTSVRGGQDGCFSAQQSRMPFFGHAAASNLSHTNKQALWGRSSDYAGCRRGEFDFLQERDAHGYEVGASKIGEESTNMDNLIPDFGWVSELIK